MRTDEKNNLAAMLDTALEQFERPLVRYATRITRDLERARDIVQDTFIAMLKTPNPPKMKYLGEWLFTVCRNRALDVRRKESRMNHLDEIQTNACTSNRPSPHEEAEKKENADKLMQTLSKLPDKQQEVIRLRFQDGFSYKQIASITGFTVSNVGFLIHTGIKTMRSCLGAAKPGDSRRIEGEK